MVVLLERVFAVMILPQVHLRKPCYDFYYMLFLDIFDCLCSDRIALITLLYVDHHR